MSDIKPNKTINPNNILRSSIGLNLLYLNFPNFNESQKIFQQKKSTGIDGDRYIYCL